MPAVKGYALHRTTLHALHRAPRAGRIRVARGITVITRIGVDDAAYRTVLACQLGLQPAPTIAVACDRDSPADRDAAARELLVVFRHPVVDIHELPGHVPVCPIYVVRRQNISGDLRAAVARDRRLV